MVVRTFLLARRARAAVALVFLMASPGFAGLLAEAPVDVASADDLGTTLTDVDRLPDGGFVVVWDRHPESGPPWNHVSVRRYGPDGSPLGNAFAVDAPGSQFDPCLASAESGAFLVAWYGEGSDGAGVYARIFGPGGSAQGEPFAVRAPGSSAIGFRPAAVRDGDGYAVAWAAADGAHLVRLDGDGVARGGHSRADADVHRVALGALPGRRLVLAWTTEDYVSLTSDSDGPVGHVDGVVLSASDDVLQDFRANEGRVRDHYDYIVDGEEFLSIAGSVNGSFSVAWDSAVPRYVYNADDHDGGFPLGAKVERFAPLASSLGSWFVDDLPVHGHAADVAMTPGGNAFFAVTGDHLGVRAVDCHGTIDGNELFHVSDEAAIVAAGASIVVDERGDGVVAWAERRPEGEAVVARRFHFDGGCALCGDADASGRVTAVDALGALRTAVGTGTCPIARCDADGSKQVGSNDAQRILRQAVSDGTSPLSCSAAPQIELVKSVPVPDSPGYWTGLGRFALVPDGAGGGVFAWSREMVSGASTFSRSVDSDLGFGPLQLLAGPDTEHRQWDTVACAGPDGLVAAWTKRLAVIPTGITLDLENVVLSLPGIPGFFPHPNTIGSQELSSLACLPDGRIAIAWRNECVAVERTSFDYYYRPDACDGEPADGIHLQLFEGDGTPYGPRRTITDASTSPFVRESALAPVEENRFVVVGGPAIQVRSGDGALLAEVEADVEAADAGLACAGTRCARTNVGRVILLDADDLDALRQIEPLPSMQLGPARRIEPDRVAIACESDGTCVVASIPLDWTQTGDYVTSELPGVYLRPFDLVSGEIGEPIRLQDADWGTTAVVVAAIEPGVFLTAVPGRFGTVVSRVDVR